MITVPVERRFAEAPAVARREDGGTAAPSPSLAALGPWLLTAGIAGLAIAWFAFSVAHIDARGHQQLPWWGMALLWAASGVAVVHIHLRRSAHTITLAEIPLVLGVMFASPAALALGRLLGSGAALAVHRRQRPLKLAFNLAVSLLEVDLAVTLFALVRGSGAPISPRGYLAAFAATLSTCALSMTLIALVVRLTGERGQLRRLPRGLATAIPVTLINTTVAIAGADRAAHDLSTALFMTMPVAALLVAYHAYLTERQRHERLRLLYESSRAFHRSRSLHATVATLMRRARDMFSAELVELVLMNGGESVPTFTLAGDAEHPVETNAPAAELVVQVARRRRGVLMSRGQDGDAATRALRDRGLRDAMVVPVTGDSGVLGVLLVADRRSDIASFDGDDLTLLETFAGQASVSIENGRLEAEMRQLAFHDSLTGLANRALLTLRLEENLQAPTRSELGPAVLFLDLDDFKTVNDSLGHATGDRLLSHVAERLRACLRPADTAARLGGDEFAILLEEVRSVADVTRVAERMIGALRSPFTVDGTRVLIHASIGVVIATRERTTADELLRDADIAMYRAKARGKGTWELFETSMMEQVRDRHLMKLDLEHALENGEMVVHYQPIVALATQHIMGVEALVRWQHPRRGMVSPEDFIPLAEETGLISAIGRFVLRRSCLEAARWSSMSPDFVLTVNLSGRQLRHEGFVAEVADVLTETGFDPSRLVLEITESVMVEDDAGIRNALLALKALGVRLAIDDFGTGYSSLSSLRELPVDILKIAKPFIDGLGRDGDDGAFAAAIVRLGQTLGLVMIAEGIERDEQLVELRPLLCSMGQGYLFARPMEGAMFSELLGRATWRHGDVEPREGQIVELFG